MSASLVGSEMCIRDRDHADGDGSSTVSSIGGGGNQCDTPCDGGAGRFCPVSYTHLTLPTICSV
eukprot:7252830-Alexandrium_andersonii.AAC.1